MHTQAKLKQILYNIEMDQAERCSQIKIGFITEMCLNHIYNVSVH